MLDEMIAAVATEVGADRVTVPPGIYGGITSAGVTVEAGDEGDPCLRYYRGVELVQVQRP